MDGIEGKNGQTRAHFSTHKTIWYSINYTRALTHTHAQHMHAAVYKQQLFLIETELTHTHIRTIWTWTQLLCCCFILFLLFFRFVSFRLCGYCIRRKMSLCSRLPMLSSAIGMLNRNARTITTIDRNYQQKESVRACAIDTID